MNGVLTEDTWAVRCCQPMAWQQHALEAAMEGDLARYIRMAEQADYERCPVDLQHAVLLAIGSGNAKLVMRIMRQIQTSNRDWNLMAATAATSGHIHLFRELVTESGGLADNWDWFATAAAKFGAWPYFWEVVRLSGGKATYWQHFIKEAKAAGHFRLARDIRRHRWVFGWMGRLLRQWKRPPTYRC